MTSSPFAPILPAGVSVAVRRTDDQDARLYRSEEAVVARAVARRRREFATARACARAALAGLGEPGRAIPAGPAGEPQWPPGFVGSITHCRGYRACAVARDVDILAIGIDAEPNQPLPERVLTAVAFGDEPLLLRRLTDAEPDVHWDRLLFSAKEAVFKAWFPLTARWLGFEDAALSIDPFERTFSARMLVPGARLSDGELRSFNGNWALDRGLILTAIAVTR